MGNLRATKRRMKHDVIRQKVKARSNFLRFKKKYGEIEEPLTYRESVLKKRRKNTTNDKE